MVNLDDAAIEDIVPSELSTASQLSRHLIDLKNRLEKSTLALIILRTCDPTPEMTQFFRKLTDVVQIVWITSAPLPDLIRGFSPDQINTNLK